MATQEQFTEAKRLLQQLQEQWRTSERYGTDTERTKHAYFVAHDMAMLLLSNGHKEQLDEFCTELESQMCLF